MIQINRLPDVFLWLGEQTDFPPEIVGTVPPSMR